MNNISHSYNPEEVLEYLLSYCRLHKKIYLYGAGSYGALYANILKNEGVQLAGFIVSKNKDNDTYLGINMYNVDEVTYLLEKDDGVILSLTEFFHSDCIALLPKDISVLSLNDRQTYAMMRKYLSSVIGDDLKKRMHEAGLLRALKKDPRMQGELIKILSKLLNDNEDNPEMLFEHRVICFDTKIHPFSIDDTGIVMQGPIQKDIDFTLKTALYYRKLYPRIPIVISTWEGEVYEDLHIKCKNANIDILENELPKTGGVGNHLFQMQSSYLGIKHINDNYNVKYVLKCRTDQRIFREDILLYLKDLLKAYPPLGNAMTSRIILDEICAFPFFIADFSAFGAIEDMLCFYLPRFTNSMDYAVRHFRRYAKLFGLMSKAWDQYKYGQMDRLWNDIASPKAKKASKMLSKFFLPEIWIPYSFYDKFIEKIEPERLIELYIDFLVRYVVSIDSIEWMRYWHKYDEDRLKLLGRAYLGYDWKKLYYSYMDKSNCSFDNRLNNSSDEACQKHNASNC